MKQAPDEASFAVARPDAARHRDLPALEAGLAALGSPRERSDVTLLVANPEHDRHVRAARR